MKIPEQHQWGEFSPKSPRHDAHLLIDRLEGRVRQLEQKVHGAPALTFSAPGVFPVQFFPIVHRVRYRYDLPECAANLGVAGSSSTTGLLYRNGLVIWEFEIVAGDVEVSLEDAFDGGDRGDRFQVECTAHGTDALDLSVQAYTVRTD